MSDEQKTHKNPGLRSKSGTDPTSPSKGTASSSSTPAPAKKYSPVLELEGKKWRVVSPAIPLLPLFQFHAYGHDDV